MAALNEVIHLNVDKETLALAPKFDMAKWTECCQSNQVSEVYRFYGERPYFSGGPTKDKGVNQPGAAGNRRGVRR